MYAKIAIVGMSGRFLDMALGAWTSRATVKGA